jgi:hypothetical protein
LIASRKVIDQALVKPVNPSNADEITKTILEIIDDKKYQEKAAKTGKELFLKTYNWEKIVKPLVDLYDAL